MVDVILSETELSSSSVDDGRASPLRYRRSSSSSTNAGSISARRRRRSRSRRHRVEASDMMRVSPTRIRSPGMRKPARPKRNPQEKVNAFWKGFTADEKTAGKATSVIPNSHETAVSASFGTKPTSYSEAAAMCRAKVEKIITDCRRVNQKYRDPHFDLEADLKLGVRDCLDALDVSRDSLDAIRIISNYNPKSAKRVSAIFDDPHFYIDGPMSDDVRQGNDGDCYLMAALCTLGNVKGLGLIERLCVKHDPVVGVYGFVFHRDGEWISEIIDDYLYLTKPDYDEMRRERILLEGVERVNPEEAYRKIYQSNSNALYFASCENPQETWLPLLEKAYAKAHGDYASIEGGFAGEALEDLTGGVTTEKFVADILDKDETWRELLQVNKSFLFSCATGMWPDGLTDQKGIVQKHSYSVSRAVEVDGKRLLRLKNPWGRGEWTGAWSDGSQEWTDDWLKKLDHKFGDDGDFWIEYSDFLRKFQVFERTRLFGEDWRMTQLWTNLQVPPMVVNYQDTYFLLSITKPGPVVIVLSQLDKKYFVGLEGEYRLELAFRVHKKGCEDYLIRSSTEAHYRMTRSANVELDLEAGDYDVRIRIHARRLFSNATPEQIIKRYADTRSVKLTRIGLAYDLAHRKGRVEETDDDKRAREAYEKRLREKRRSELREQILEERKNAHYLRKKMVERETKAQRKRPARSVEKRTKMKGQEVVVKQQGSASEENGHDEITAEIGGKDKNGINLHHEDTEPQEPAKEGYEPRPPAAQGQRYQQPSTSEKDDKETLSPQNSQHTDKEWDKVSDNVRSGLSHPFDADGDGGEAGKGDEALSELSEREMDLRIDALEKETANRDLMAGSEGKKGDTDEENEDISDAGVGGLGGWRVPKREPWNAVAVIALRVHYKHDQALETENGEVVKLKVVRPSLYLSPEDGDEYRNGASGVDAAERGKVKEEKKILEREESKSGVLDVDDSAKDATLEGSLLKREMSILGEDNWQKREEVQVEEEQGRGKEKAGGKKKDENKHASMGEEQEGEEQEGEEAKEDPS